VKRILWLALVGALIALMLAASTMSVSAQNYSGQYASEGQYASTESQAGCGWYWDYTFSKRGGWEWWCWSPQLGWWYGESADGKSKIIAPKTTTAPLQITS
jgi:hypothetical protein